MLLHQLLLRRAVQAQTLHSEATDEQVVLLEFIDTVGSHLLTQFARVPALGGSGQPAGLIDPNLPHDLVFYTAEALENFSKLPDQSLATHILSGIFAGVRMATYLPEEKRPSQEELRVWLLGFVVHDYTKVYGIEIKAGQLPVIRQVITKLGETLHFAEFVEDWLTYLDDITFIAQNVQKVRGANLNQSAYPNHRLSWRRLEILRLLGSYADLLVHVTSPADVVFRDGRDRDIAQNIRFTLADLCGADRAPRLAYHKLSEVRGLLSNMINTAVMEVLQGQGYLPYLFFPDGVVYIATSDQEVQIDLDKVITALWEKLGAVLMGAEGDDQPDDEDSQGDTEEVGGLKITRTKDYMKVQPVLYEILPLPKLLEAGKTAALKVRNALAAERLGSEIVDQEGLATSRMALKDKKLLFGNRGNAYAEAERLPVDVRADQLAEFLGFMQRRVLKELFPKADWISPMLLEALGLSDISATRAEAQRSGTPTGWFYVAARYLRDHPGLSPDELAGVMDAVITHVLCFLDQYGLTVKPRESMAQAFRSYLSGIIAVDGQPLGRSVTDITTHIGHELTGYIERKAKNKEVCTLCSSPYECTPQDISVVLFKGQQYSNKAKLDTSKVIRGICPICSIEMMLRQVQQGMPPKTAQDEKPVAVYLYPTYFFTAETAYVIKLFIQELSDLSMLNLIFKHLEPNGFSTEQILTYEQFTLDDQQARQTQRRVFSLKKPRYGDDDPAGLFFFTLRPPMKDPTDTDAWIVPTFYALALPLLLNLKVVVSSSFVPIYASGAEFRQTALLDGPHGFTKYVLPSDHLHVNDLTDALLRLLRLYELHLDVFAEPKDMHWGMLNAVAKDIATDPLYVFSYYDRKQRAPKEESTKGKGKAKAKSQPKNEGGDAIPPYIVDRYMAIYHTLRRDTVTSFIAQLVDDYAVFYRADYDHLGSAYTVLRPFGTAIDVTKNSSPDTSEEDLILMIAGAIEDEMDRIKNDKATTAGFDPIGRKSSVGLEKSRQAIAHFAHQFVALCFKGYCKGDRGILRERANRMRSAASFHYLSQYARRSRPDTGSSDTTATPGVSNS
jgi:CRISPR-associated protein Csc3